MRNIVVTGTCDAEVQGILSLLDGEGISAVRAGASPLSPDDLLIVAMSAEPLLGWGRHLSWLLAMKLRWRCTMVVLTSNQVADVRLLEAVGGCVVPEGYSLRWVSNALLCLVAKWRQGKPLPVGNVRRISEVHALDIDEMAYFFAQTMPVTGAVKLSKTEYGRRHRALFRMGFCHLQQLRLFMAGVMPKEVLNAWLLLQQGYCINASADIASLLPYNKGNVGHAPISAVRGLMSV